MGTFFQDIATRKLVLTQTLVVNVMLVYNDISKTNPAKIYFLINLE